MSDLGLKIAAALLIMLLLVGCSPPAAAPPVSEPPESSAVATAEALAIPTLEVVDATGLPPTEELDGTRPEPGSYRPFLTGEMVEAAEWMQNPDTGEMAIDVLFDKDGTTIWRDWTRAHTGARVAILIDGRVISSPTVAAPVSDGHLLIGGDNLERPLMDEIGSAVVPKQQD